jgi:hypothetical protein
VPRWWFHKRRWHWWCQYLRRFVWIVFRFNVTIEIYFGFVLVNDILYQCIIIQQIDRKLTIIAAKFSDENFKLKHTTSDLILINPYPLNFRLLHLFSPLFSPFSYTFCNLKSVTIYTHHTTWFISHQPLTPSFLPQGFYYL